MAPDGRRKAICRRMVCRTRRPNRRNRPSCWPPSRPKMPRPKDNPMPDMLRRFVPATVRSLGDNECEITLATSRLALDDDIWDMDGGDLSHFEAHPILLFNHQPELPVARASSITRSSEHIAAKATFAPAGVSAKADEVRGLVKSGILTGVSAGIIPI